MIEVKEKYKNYLNTREGADTYNRFKEILYGTPDTLVLRLADRIMSHVHRKKLSILDVGGGDGKRLILLIDLLHSKGIECSATLVDQSGIFINDFDATDNFTANIQAVHSTFEAFESSQKYDLVLLIHSIFTFEDSFYVDKIKNLLNPQGIAIIVADTSDSFLAGLKAITDSSFGTERKNILSVVKDFTDVGFMVEQEMSDTCYGDCLSDGALNDNGKLILRWIALRDWSDIPPAIVDMATKLFIDKSNGGKICDKECFVYASL